MAKGKRLNRTTDMDNALFEALKTPVPKKDTGPDPDDILSGLFDDDEVAEAEADDFWQQVGKTNSLAVSLDDADRARALQIAQYIGEQTGENIDLAGAIKIALCACPLDDQLVLEARKITGRKSGKNE